MDYSVGASAPYLEKRMLAHNLFFTLANNSPANRDKLIAGCKKYFDRSSWYSLFAPAAGLQAEELASREVK